MLTTANPITDIVSQNASSTQIETVPSDAEILQRVNRIRSGWSISERLHRREEASQRFADLVDALLVGQHAA